MSEKKPSSTRPSEPCAAGARTAPDRRSAAEPGHRADRRAAQPSPQPDETMISDVPLAASRRSATRVATSPAPRSSRRRPVFDTVGGVQLNRFCASGLKAVNTAAQKVRSGWDDLVIAGGGVDEPRSDGLRRRRHDVRPGHQLRRLHRSCRHRRRPDRHPEGFTRDDVDAYAVQSQERAAAAWSGGYFAVGGPGPGPERSAPDPRPRRAHAPRHHHGEPGQAQARLEGLAAMAGFDDVAMQKYHWIERINHVHTGGNSSASSTAQPWCWSATKSRKASTDPRARVVATAATSGADPTIMLVGPTPATEKALGDGRV